MTIYTIYKITNTVNSKVYIGKTSKSIHVRLEGHIKASTQTTQSHIKLGRSIRKYGISSFEIEAIFVSKDAKYINDMENIFIIEFDSRSDVYGYNMAPGGQGGDIKSIEQKTASSNLFKTCNPIHKVLSTEEGRRAFSEAVSNGTKLGHAKSEKYKESQIKNKERMSSDLNPAKNKSDETREKLSISQKLRMENINNRPIGAKNGMYGKTHSIENKKIMSEIHTGTVSVYNLETSEYCRVPKSEFDKFKTIKYVGTTSKLIPRI